MTIGEALQKYSEYLGLTAATPWRSSLIVLGLLFVVFLASSSLPKDNNGPSDPKSFSAGPDALAPSVQLGEVA